MLGEGPVGGRPLPVTGIRGYHPGKLFETETSVGAFLRIQKAIL